MERRLLQLGPSLVLGLGVMLTACKPAPPPVPQVAFRIAKIDPGAVFLEGGTAVSITTENACAPADMTAKLGEKVPLTLVAKGPDLFQFVAPAMKAEQRSEFSVQISCAGHPVSNPAAVYSNPVATASLVYDPALEPAPELVAHGPTGERVSVLTKASIRFNREMDGASINPQTFFIELTPGGAHADADVAYDPATKAATLTLRNPLPYASADFSTGKYTVVALSGAQGIRSARGKPLHTTLSAAGPVVPERDTFTFTVRREGEGAPWMGDVSAAAGISRGGGYKLFSVTGQPTPVGQMAPAGGQPGVTVQAGGIYAAPANAPAAPAPAPTP